MDDLPETEPAPEIKLGLVHETDEEYHNGGQGVSKSGLWKIWEKTPFHFRYGVREETAEFAIGKAAHIAILEPETLEARVTKGPADRRGNKWKDAMDFANKFNTILLTEGDYDTALLIRDLAATNEYIRMMQGEDTIVETSAYVLDEATGVQVKCRPDMYSHRHKIIADIKSTANASADEFSRSIGKFGYHVQEAMYSDVWERGTGFDVEAFFFVAFEKSEPPLVSVFELDAAAVAEGHAIYRAMLERYAECERTDEWPGYPTTIQKVGLRSKWDYKLTTPPAGGE